MVFFIFLNLVVVGLFCHWLNPFVLGFSFYRTLMIYEWYWFAATGIWTAPLAMLSAFSLFVIPTLDGIQHTVISLFLSLSLWIMAIVSFTRWF